MTSPHHTLEQGACTAPPVPAARSVPPDPPPPAATPGDLRSDGRPTPEAPEVRDVRRERAGLAAALVIVVVYAASNLNATPLWHDEGYTLGAMNDLWASLRGTHGTMGLYYTIMWLWGFVSTATWWLRLPSVIFALASLCLLRPIARRIGGSDLVALALPLAALVPMFAWKSTEARSYSLETLVVCASWYALLRATDAEDDRTAARWYLVLAPLTLAGVLSHGLFLIHLAPLGVVALLGPRPLRALRWMLPAGAVGLAMAYALHVAGASSVGTMINGGPQARVHATVELYFVGSVVHRPVFLQLVVVGAGLALYRLRRIDDPTERMVAMVPAAWSFVPTVALVAMDLIGSQFNARYLAPISLGLALVAAGLLLDIDRRTRRWAASSRGWKLPTIGVASAVGLLLAFHSLAVAPPLHDDEWRTAARLVAAEVQAGDGIVFPEHGGIGTMHHRVPFEASWREIPHDTTPASISPPRPLGDVRRFDRGLARDDLVRAAADHDRVWIVEHQDLGMDLSPGLVESLADIDFQVVETWTVPSDISVILLQRSS